MIPFILYGLCPFNSGYLYLKKDYYKIYNYIMYIYAPGFINE